MFAFFFFNVKCLHFLVKAKQGIFRKDFLLFPPPCYIPSPIGKHFYLVLGLFFCCLYWRCKQICILFIIYTHVFTQRSCYTVLLYFWSIFLISIHNWRLDEREENNYCLRIHFIVLNNVFTFLQATGPCWIVGRKGWLNRGEALGLPWPLHPSKQTSLLHIKQPYQFWSENGSLTKRNFKRKWHNCQPKSTDSVLLSKVLGEHKIQSYCLVKVSNLSPKKTLGRKSPSIQQSSKVKVK